mgnify:CR=1 FL=1
MAEAPKYRKARKYHFQSQDNAVQGVVRTNLHVCMTNVTISTTGAFMQFARAHVATLLIFNEVLMIVRRDLISKGEMQC